MCFTDYSDRILNSEQIFGACNKRKSTELQLARVSVKGSDSLSVEISVELKLATGFYRRICKALFFLYSIGDKRENAALAGVI